MPGPLFTAAGPQGLDSSGNPLSGGNLSFFVPGTTTPKNVFSDQSLSTSIGSVVPLEASGRPENLIYLNGSYRVQLIDTLDVVVVDADPINSADDFSFELVNDTTPQLGGNLDVQTFGIIATGDDDIDITPNVASGTARINLNGARVRINSNYTLAPDAPASAGLVLTSMSTSTSAWQAAPVPQGYRDPTGAQISINGSDTNHDIDISAGTVRDAVDSTTMQLTSTLTKRIDANWTAGTNAGGFPSGLTLTADIWYRVFLIRDTVNDIVDGGYDTSATATNLLADATDYSTYRQVGWVRTNVGSNITPFQIIQGMFGQSYIWDTITEDEANLVLTLNIESVVTLDFLPPVPTYADLVFANPSAATSVAAYHPSTSTDTVNVVYPYRFDAVGLDIAANVFTNSSNQVAILAPANVTLDVYVKGFIDPQNY